MHHFNRAKKAKNNEFFTLIDEIENEVINYQKQFANKTVFCNCNDGKNSHFFQFFQTNFNQLQLKKLIGFSFNNLSQADKFTFDGNKVTKTKLKGNGDFSSDESIEVLKQADIVVTNPPFSLFQSFIDLLIQHNKQFLVLGLNAAVSYNHIFTYFKTNKLWFGYTVNKTMSFSVNSDYQLYNPKTSNFFTKNGKCFQKIAGISWFTNLGKPHYNPFLNTNCFYKNNEKNYPKFDWYDAIYVNKIKNIPMDWNGLMGVPLTFLNCYNPKQFELVDCLANPYATLDTLKTNAFVKLNQGDVRNVNGKRRYVRVIIKKQQI
ncbi:adenine-specific methyltransferase EcoRI family protein [Mycoplasmoides genitalium]|uniref:adenine-specific methyltransferase EcoRI family protein n=1 Tax=Mycoplasmoides genitalium TaxID=2097 RepID=UPI00027B3D08|nr:adenine-specific methyltransferase EcoRI family protein [Mycoplasmoides genitalium]AFQ03008.1 adenine-specific DNA modification methylase [Mycoplasmoides genitalium M2321]